MKSLLKQYFGYDEFRPPQEEVIRAVMDKKDALVLMPTGGGKSLCYQLPALKLSGATLVVSPLIALMKDQVDALRENGVPAGFVNSQQTYQERIAVQKAAYYGDVKLLYVAPERIAMPEFQRFVAAADVSLIAVDEAHCISQWGHEFRPDYRALNRMREISPDTPIIALTATATRQVRDDIVEQLNLSDPKIFVAGFDRPNLRYSVLPNADRYERLIAWLNANPNASAIVYRSSRSGVDEMVGDLAGDGIQALPYHAGLESDVRAMNQERFVRDEARVMVATVAFGMGIDKPDVRLVMHYETPDSVERYYQESGRAGRDGLESECILFYGAREKDRLEYLINRNGDEIRRAAAERQLEAMVAYCQQATCRRAALLQYFGETPGWQDCGNCDVCSRETFDATIIAQKILSAVIRTGNRYGSTYIAQVLKGVDNAQTRQRGHQSLSVFGIVDDYTHSALREFMTGLVGKGFLQVGGEYPTLSVTSEGRAFLSNRDSVRLPAPQTRVRPYAAPADPLEYDKALLENLSAVRMRLAQERNVPPYAIFSSNTLRDMAAYVPITEDSLLKISGIGPRKVQNFGKDFLVEIRAYAQQRGLQDKTSEIAARRSSPPRARRSAANADPLEYDEALFERLRAVRTRLAREREVPPYVIFGDRALREMAAYSPTTPDTFLRINGVGQRKLQDFGDQFIEAIRSYVVDKGAGSAEIGGRRFGKSRSVAE